MSPKTNSSQELKVEERTVNFVADVHLIPILGEQLIKSEKVGILELIKNAYDARAAVCDVWIERVPRMPEAELSDPAIANLPGPVITITDNGRGMDENTIIHGWLRPATRLKTSIKEKLKQERKEADLRGARAEYESLVDALKREHGGRLPIGEKGVGRFATHRLGTHLILQTKTEDDPLEWVLEFNWEQFDKPNDDPLNNPLGLEDIKLTLIHRPPERDYGPTKSGTMIRMYGEREGFKWSEEKLRDIGEAMAFLRSPHKDTKKADKKGAKKELGFSPRFHCPQLSSAEIEVLTETIPAPFICTAIVDEQGKGDIEIRFAPPSSLKKPLSTDVKLSESVELRVAPSENKKYWLVPQSKTELRSPECGPFTCEIKVWIRTSDWIDYPDTNEFTRFLERFGGIGIYRDGLSMVPAQVASKDDWLGLASRQIKKSSNISYYNMAGSVDLVQENTLDLIDLTSREGMLETGPFNDLRKLLQQIIYHVENYVKGKRDEYKSLLKTERPPVEELVQQSQVASAIIKSISESYDFKADSLDIKSVIGKVGSPKKAVSTLVTVFDQLRDEVTELTEQTDALLEAAGYGIAIGVAVHEIEKITSNLYFGLERLLKKASSMDSETYHQVDQLSQTSNALLNELKRIAPLRVTRLERQRRFSIRDSILAASGAFKLSWDDLEINFVSPTKDADFEILGSFGACSQVLANLFDNATYWLRTIETKRRIAVQVNASNRRVIVADSGPNIDKKIRPNLFKPFFSLKNPPSGLGLYICSYYMRQMKGTIREAYDSERLSGFNGAQFTIIFPTEDKE